MTSLGAKTPFSFINFSIRFLDAYLVINSAFNTKKSVHKDRLKAEDNFSNCICVQQAHLFVLLKCKENWRALFAHTPPHPT